MVGRAIMLSDGFESPAELQRPLFKLIDHHQKLVDAEVAVEGQRTHAERA